MELRERVARALATRNGSLEVWENYPPGTAYRDVFDHQADAALEALGLNDLDGFVRRLHEGYFDDDGPSAVEYACMRNAVQYAFTPTKELQSADG